MKSYLSLKILSLSGFVSLFILIFYCFTVVPEVRALNEINRTDAYIYTSLSSMPYLRFYCFQFIFSLFLIIMLAFEMFLRKKGKNLRPDFLKSFNPYLLWIGIFFAFMPLYLLILTLTANRL